MKKELLIIHQMVSNTVYNYRSKHEEKTKANIYYKQHNFSFVIIIGKFI